MFSFIYSSFIIVFVTGSILSGNEIVRTRMAMCFSKIKQVYSCVSCAAFALLSCRTTSFNNNFGLFEKYQTIKVCIRYKGKVFAKWKISRGVGFAEALQKTMIGIAS